MRKYWIILLLILFSSFAYAVCPQQEKFIDRIKDNCTEANNVCDDGEYPFVDEDCSLDLEAFSCKGDRCAFQEIWLAKFVLIYLGYMLLSKKKDYTVLIFVCIVFLAMSYFDLGNVELAEPTINNTVEIPAEFENDNILMKYGKKVMPSNPIVGIGILLSGVFLIVWYISKNFGFNRGAK